MATTSAQDTQKADGIERESYSQEVREKYWSEIAIEEKIERLRNLVKSLVLTTDSQRSELASLRTFIWDHAHEENGDVIVKFKKADRYRLEENKNSGLNIAAKSLRRDLDKQINDEVYI